MLYYVFNYIRLSFLIYFDIFNVDIIGVLWFIMLMFFWSEVILIYFILISLVEIIYIVKYKILFILDLGFICLVIFILNLFINFCYYVVEIIMLWLDVKGYCEVMGVRFVVLDILGKFDVIFIGYFCFLIFIK